jgi:Predicted aminopeptidases
MRKPFLYLTLCLCFYVVNAQKLRKDEKKLISNLEQHIKYLSDDKLEGRRSGSPGEAAAADYIDREFNLYGLSPKGINGYAQTFTIDDGRKIGEHTELLLDHNRLNLNIDYFPLAMSANGTVDGSSSLALQEPGTPWFFDLKESIEENNQNPHFNIDALIFDKAKEFQKKGARALLVYNSDKNSDPLEYDPHFVTEKAGIPVIYLTKNSSHFLADETATLDIHLVTELTDLKRTAMNVVGYIDNKAHSTVIIGAHFDHLGHGEDANGLSPKNGSDNIYNGADDNASGTAALIELGRLIKSGGLKNQNYLLIAFSGEELGLLGSKYFVSHPTINLKEVNYMINLDMVGRLNDLSKTVTVGGYGTSSEWGNVYSGSKSIKLFTDGLSFRFDSTGVGPSDHTSFYLRNIPVLFYFTGIHSDYHKVSDEADKINFKGEMFLVKHIYSLLQYEDKKDEKLAFVKTQDNLFSDVPKFTVTLGIMPDYSFLGDGVRIDAISDQRPAQKAGLLSGDIILSLGGFGVHSLNSYMEALSRFKKGDKAIVEYKREGQKLSSTVEF